MEEIDDLSLGTAASPNGASAEVNPASVGNEVEGITGAAEVEPGCDSAGVRISPPPEDTTEDTEAETSLPVQDARTAEEDMAELADTDLPEFPNSDLEKDEEDEFKPR